MTRYTSHGIEHYHQATLALLEDHFGEFTLDGTGTVQKQFYRKIKPLLTAEDYEPFRTCPEPRWETRFRFALKHMREDGRVKWHGHGQYKITESGRRFLLTTHLPLELMTEEVEVMDDGEIIIRYLLSDGTVSCEFGHRSWFVGEPDEW
jgi:hypothetical protein